MQSQEIEKENRMIENSAEHRVVKAPFLLIRQVTEADAERLAEIYAPYVEHTAITFEYEAPDAEEFRKRIRKIRERYPYLVAETGGVVVGYAYASPFKEREAYDWSCELSIYVDQQEQKKGIGKQLYHALEKILGAM